MKVTDVGLAVIVGPCAVPVMGTVTLLAPVPVAVSTRLAVDVPPAVEMAYRLRQRGMDIPEDILTEEELVRALKR